ncbi:hypothetical protein CGN74_11035 [Salmonella enterica]|nr:hypothetical protein [Salmonella enterica subsp. houtenae serovar 48:g,z51:-]EAW8702421.1 hypothetical protein [Salmonella enterica]EAV6819577.1 hypothetical protein [Salmonella enterica subsp. houtenae serovar 48:g,z51:-]EAZ7995025.1 hypothetical protein [Salmonella enterica]ECK0289500.1 hypothetical protein [Salmonella enterica]
MSCVINLGKEKKFPITQELFDRISDVVHEYDGYISLCDALGTLELLKSVLISEGTEHAAKEG